MTDGGGGPRSDRLAVCATAAVEPWAGPGVVLAEAVLRAWPGALAVAAGPELRYACLNDAFRSLCPDPEAPLLGERLADSQPLLRDSLAELAREVLVSGTAAEGETEALVGVARRWFTYRIRRLEAPAGPGVLLALEESTARVQARQAAEAAADEARRRAAELEAIMEAIPDALVVFDGAGAVVRMNAAATESWRAAGVEVREPTSLFSQFELRAEDGAPIPQGDWPVKRALGGERVHGKHLRFTPAGGRPIWMLASAAPILGRAGEVTGAVLEFADETALHELAEARDDLIRMVSHDLRTPLSAIYAQAHLIRRGGALAGNTVERAAAIERGCERMSGMIQDLVEVTLLEAGQLPVSTTSVDLRALVPEILQGMHGGLDVERVRLEPGDPCWAEVDPARLERVVVNLVSNALKYSSQTVEVSLRREGTLASVSVADRGVGISPDDQARIFQRYFRAKGDRRPEGLGLGLYITRLLAEGMGGHVEVESTLGAGSTFRVLLPAPAACTLGR